MQPTVIPGRVYNAVATDRKSSLLVHFRARDFSPLSSCLLTGQTPAFTRATAGGMVRGRHGLLRTPVHSQPRVEMYDPSSVSGLALETPGLLIEPQATQICPNPQAPASWTDVGTPVLTTGQADPWGGSAALLIEDNDGAADEGKSQAVVFTGDATKATMVAVRAGTVAAIRLRIFDSTAGTTRHTVTATWNGGTAAPTLASIAGAGSLFSPIGVFDSAGNLWWLVPLSADGVVAANTNVVQVLGGANAAATGTFYFAGANAWDATYPSSWISAAATVRNADALTAVLSLGALTLNDDDFTIYARVARPQHADATGTLGNFPGICRVAVTTPSLGLYFDSTTRQIGAHIDTATTDSLALRSIPSGAIIEACGQYQSLVAGGQARLDVGSGFGALASAAAAFAAFGDTTLRLGLNNSVQLGSGLIDLKIARGLYTMQQMREAL